MKILFVVLMIVLFASVGEAAPFLTCDPYPSTSTQPTYFLVTKDGGVQENSTPQVVTGGVRLHFDLVGLTTGVHNWSVAACNEWGCSSSTPFGFTKNVPGAPAGLKLESQ